MGSWKLPDEVDARACASGTSALGPAQHALRRTNGGAMRAPEMVDAMSWTRKWVPRIIMQGAPMAAARPLAKAGRLIGSGQQMTRAPTATGVQLCAI